MSSPTRQPRAVLVAIIAAAMVTASTSAWSSPAVLEVAGQLAASGEGLAVAGEEGWLFLRSELRHLGAGQFWGDAAQTASQANRADRRDPLPAITAYARDLAQAGVQLVVVPVPAKAAVYADLLPGAAVAPGDGRVDSHHVALYGELRDAGVEVVDLMPLFLQERAGGTQMYLRTDSHWTPAAAQLAASHVAQRIRDLRPETQATELAGRVAESRLPVTGDLWEAAGTALETDLVALFTPHFDGVPIGAAGEDQQSPVMVIADSHGLVFHSGGDMFADGAGFSDHLAQQLGQGVALTAVRGSAATPARVAFYRNVRQSPDLLATTKVVVWLFAARELTETSGWAIVPVRPS